MIVSENISGYLKLVFLLLVLSISNAKALDHPTIWATNADKSRILENISKYSWAANMANDMRSRVNPIKVLDKSNPAVLVNSFSAVPGSRGTHCDALDRAVDASIIYFLYGETDYAQLAADILNYYAVALGVPDYTKCDVTTEDAFMESRSFYPRFAIAYDFIYNYVNLPLTTVYDRVSASRKPFNHAKAQQTCKNFADLVFKRGNLHTNWSVLEGAGALYNVLCITDDVVREQYFLKYWNGDTNHDGFNAYTLQQFKGDGMWPESHSYSKFPQEESLTYMEVIDNAKPELNVITNNPKVIEGAFLFRDFCYPNNIEAPAWGDSHRQSGGSENLLSSILKMATRKNLPELVKRVETLLKQSYALKGYNPIIITSHIDWDQPLKLLWGFNVDLTGKIPSYEYKTTAIVDHAGLVFQRNINCIDTAMNGLAYYSGGNHYVHSHLSGLGLELYGAGYVMGGVGADVESPDDRGTDLNTNYYRIYAGHNTVIVNGTSKGRGSGSWKSDGILWQNKTVSQATEPKEFEKPLSPNYSFATQFLGDGVNNCHQQRTNAIIRTSPNTGYYLDLFRSKSLGENKFHDYVYHNIGDELLLNRVDNSPLPLSPQTSRYTSIDVTYSGDVVKFPGWHYFTNVNTSTKTENAVTGRVKLNLAIPRYMHLNVPEGRSREYSTALSPPVLEAAAGYNKKDAHVFTMRQYGEAWNRPFVTIFEPSTNSVASVKSVSTLKNDTVTVGVKVVSVVADTTITDWVLSHDAVTGQSDLLSENISFKGRFGIVRLKSFGGKDILSLYIGEGESLRCGDKIITTDASLRAFETYETVSAVTTLQKKSFQIYPTAANSKIFTIETGSMNDYTCTLYDISGKEYRLDHFVGSKTLNLTGFKSGVYLLKLQNERTCVNQKLIIK